MGENIWMYFYMVLIWTMSYLKSTEILSTTHMQFKEYPNWKGLYV